MSERHSFQAEVGRLLDIVAHALYTEKEIFLRELISNAADACDRLRYMAIARPELVAGASEFRIDLTLDAPARTLKIADNGVGMDSEELVKNLGTIAHSGTREIMKRMADGPSKDLNLIGQFGVGFYSAFMVADKVEVLSLKAGTENAHLWTSDGRGEYVIDSALKKARGTEITLHIKEDASDFLVPDRLKAVIRKYSDHIGCPIYLDGEKVNTAAALWMRSKNEISVDDYKSFYRSVSGSVQFDEPWLTLHWRAEGAFEYNNLLFIPSMKPFDLYDPRRHHGVKLYVRRVFIAEGTEGLIPPFLRFVKGVVDSEDLPLNISRETLQDNPIVAKMSTVITRKILSELQEKAEKESDAFAQFWALFGPVIKEGLYDAHTYRTQLCKVVRFHSSRDQGLVSLDEYVDCMSAGQEYIYYISAPSLSAAQNSPQLEAFRAKGVEVLFMTDPIDEFWLPMQADYREKKFKSVTRGAAELEAVNGAEKVQEKETSKAEKSPALLSRLKEILGEEVKDVTFSERLVDSPVCLVAPEGDIDIHMQRILKKQQAYEDKFRPILEVNAYHPLIQKLQSLIANDPGSVLVTDTAYLLLDQARIIEGEPLKNPAAFVRRMSQAIEKGLMGEENAGSSAL